MTEAQLWAVEFQSGKCKYMVFSQVSVKHDFYTTVAIQTHEFSFYCESRVTGVMCWNMDHVTRHASPSMTDERSSMWHTSKLGNFARIFDFSTLVLLIFILWHSPFSNPPKIHSRSAENMIALDEIGGLSHAFGQGDKGFVILQYPQTSQCDLNIIL